MPTLSAQTLGAQAAPPTQPISITAGEYQYLRRQSMNILAGGGSEEDVARFLEIEGHRMPARAPAAPPQQQDVETPSFVRGFSMRALQGITFGFGDEAMGAMLGVLTGDGARGGIETYRKEMDAWSAQHRKAGIVAEIGGALLTGGAVARGATALFGKAVASTAPTLAQRAAAAAGQGAVAGGFSGAGHAEGGFSERTKHALFGATLGAGLAGTVVPAARLVGTVSRPIVRSLTRGAQGLQRALPGVGTPEMQARELLARALKQDGIDVNTAVKRLDDFTRTGTNPSIADLGGDATLQLARDAMAQRTPAKQQLVESLLGRQGEQADRLSVGLFRRIFRSNRLGMRNAYEAEETLAAARSQAATPLYQQAFQETVPVSPRMRQLLMHPKFAAAYRIGRSIAADEDLAGVGHGLAVPPIPLAKGMPLRVAETLFPTELPVRGLDYMKRGLDVVIKRSAEGAKPTLDRQAARTLRNMLGEVLEEVDGKVPAYAQARTVFRGFSEAKDAVTVGRDVLSKAPEVIRREVAALRPSERDFYRMGAAQSLYERVTRTTSETADVARQFFGGRLFGGKSIQGERIRALFPDAPEVADDLMRLVAAETRISHTTARAVRGPQAAGVEQIENVTEGAIPTVRASMGVMLANIARTGLVKARTGFANDVSDDLALLFSKGLQDPDELRALLFSLEHVQGKLAQRAGVGSRAAAAIGEMVGGVR